MGVMADAMKEFGGRLREERLRLGRKPKEFADQSGIHENSLADYELGKTPPKVTLMLIWQDLDVDIGYVLTGLRSSGNVDIFGSELIRLMGKLSQREREGILSLAMHLAGETQLVRDIGPASNTTLHSPANEFRSKPKDI